MEWFSSLKLARGANSYSLYVLALLLFAYLLNQLDRYTLAIVTKPAAQEIGYGDKGCMKNETIGAFNNVSFTTCLNINSESECYGTDSNETLGCKWDYTGQGFDYQILAGPMFIGIYTFAAIPVGIAADVYNRKRMRRSNSDETKKASSKTKDPNNNDRWLGTAYRGLLKHLNMGVLLGISVAFWSLCTLLTGFVDSYWQLLVLRFGLGLGQSGCTPFATSLISDYFSEQLRGAALGVYNWGIYTGYSMSFALGNIITKANINGQGWRWVFIIAGIPGIFLGLLIMFTVKEPKRVKAKNEDGEETPKHENTVCGKLIGIANSFCRPSVLLLCIAGSIRNAAGYVWAYNTQVYYESLGQSRTDIAFWLSWIPMVGGSIGVLVGGFISDRFVLKSGPHGRIWVLIMSQILAAPFAAGALLLPTPYAYISLIPTYIIGEMWVSVTLAVLVELVPSKIKTTSVAVYFFIISNIGGNMPLVVPVLQPIFQSYGYTKIESLRYTLLTLYPGEYVLGSALFLLTLFVLKNDIEYIKSQGSSSSRGSKADIVTNMEKAGSQSLQSVNSNQNAKEQTKM